MSSLNTESEEGLEVGSIANLRDEMLAELERLRQLIQFDDSKYDEKIENLSEEERIIFKKFLKLFKYCAICNKKNHDYYLKRFYFDPNPEKTAIKNSLINLITNLDDLERIHIKKKISLGIGLPCCECFEKFFGKTHF